MKRKRKQTSRFNIRPELVMAAFVVGGIGLGLQARAELGVSHVVAKAGAAVRLGTVVTPAVTPRASPPPTATPTPSTTPPVVVKRVAKSVPVVKAVPHSNVSHLVAVAPSGAPGRGAAGGGSSTPTPTPTPGAGPSYAYESSNWGGYLASDGNFTSVSGSWAVPNVSGNGITSTGDATWIGIGGVTSQDLIQVGTTDTVTRSGQVFSSAFYEMLPAVEMPVPNMAVTPGDAMTASVTQGSGNQWQISITDISRDETFTTTVSYASSNSTAEWIEEDPSFAGGGLVPFDNFGLVKFDSATAVENGSPVTLTSAGAQGILLVDAHGAPLATPSALGADGDSFSVSGG